MPWGATSVEQAALESNRNYRLSPQRKEHIYTIIHYLARTFHRPRTLRVPKQGPPRGLESQVSSCGEKSMDFEFLDAQALLFSCSLQKDA